MWIYEKQLQYPVKIARPNPRLAGLIITALGGPDGETGASMRYLNQRFTMPDGRVIGILTDVGTEEMGHQEMVASIVYQLTRNLTPAEIIAGGFDKYYVDNGAGIYPASASGVPFNAAAIASVLRHRARPISVSSSAVRAQSIRSVSGRKSVGRRASAASSVSISPTPRCTRARLAR